MAEMLSVVRSAIAVYQIADRLGQLLSKAKHLSRAPSEVFALSNEISDLTIILQSFEQCLLPSGAGRITIPEPRLQHLSGLIKKAKEKLLELEKLIHMRFLKSGSLQRDFKVFRLEWIKDRAVADHHQRALKRIQENIVMEVQGIGL